MPDNFANDSTLRWYAEAKLVESLPGETPGERFVMEAVSPNPSAHPYQGSLNLAFFNPEYFGRVTQGQTFMVELTPFDLSRLMPAQQSLPVHSGLDLADGEDFAAGLDQQALPEQSRPESAGSASS